MNEILLNTQVIIYFIGEFISFILLSISFIYALFILKSWNFENFNQKQFKLEEKSFLQSTIIYILFFIKIILLIFFIYTIDSLSLIIPGAMCAAGVISANSFGLKLLFIKIVIIFFLMLWLNIHKFDIKAINYPFIKIKSSLLIFIFILFLIEFTLDILYFTNININLPVSCCSTLFGQLEGQNPLPFGLNITTILVLFYLLFISTILFLINKQFIFSFFSSLLFIYISYYSVVYFFGIYIYELPTHKCPFCMMQKEYYYIGYFIWGTLFIGGFLAIIYSFLAITLKKILDNSRKIAITSLTIFVILCTFYVIKYYFINGVFL